MSELLINKAIEEAAQKLLTDLFPDYTTPNQAKGNIQVNNPQKSRAVAPAKPVDYSLPLD